MWKFSVNLFLLIALPFSVLAQSKYLPSGVRVGLDVGNPVYKQIADKQRSVWEIQTDVDFHDYLFNLDLGRWDVTRVSGANTIQSVGSFYRVGADVNLFKNEPQYHAVFLGFRYANGLYSNQINVNGYDSLFGEFNFEQLNEGIKAQWLELVVGTKTHLGANFYLGFTYRMKFGLNLQNEGSYRTYTVPGYGTRDRNLWSGVNYYLMYRIPLRKKEFPQKKKK